MSKSKRPESNTGKRRVNVYTLNRLMTANGLTLEGLCVETEVTKDTARRMLAGGPSKMTTLATVAEVLGVSLIDLVDPAEFEPPIDPKAAPAPVTTNEWSPGKALTAVQTTSNGLQYRLFRMQHRHQPTRFGRGKRYEFAHLSDDAQEQLKDRLVRHTEVCDRIGRHPQFPICFSTYPEAKDRVWWVVDEWVDGPTLANRLAEGPPQLELAAKWAHELASGLAALHEADIIRRELNPDCLLIREPDDTLMLTDFELAKLAGNLPTVSQTWPDDPYRAPEIGAGEPTLAADLYSWGRIVTRLVAGELPPRGNESDVLVKSLPKAILEIVCSCTAQRQSQRPASFADLLPPIETWRHSHNEPALTKRVPKKGNRHGA